MYSNIFELIYILFTSSLLHLIIVISIIYVVYKFILIKKNNDQISNEVISEVNIFIDVLYSNIQQIPIISKYLSKSNIKKILYNIIPSPSENDIIEEQKINDENDKQNKPYMNRLKIFFIIILSVFVGLFIIYNIFVYKKISYKFILIELITSLVLVFGLLALYEYLFAYLFIFKYTDYHIYNFFKNKILYSDNIKVYDYKS
jgi:hypothetical protein